MRLLLTLIICTTASAATCPFFDAARAACPAGACDCTASTVSCDLSADGSTATFTSNSQACWDMNSAGQPFQGGYPTDFSISTRTTGIVGQRYKAVLPTGIVGVAINGVPIASPWERSEVVLDQSSVNFDSQGGHSFATGQYHQHKDAPALYKAAAPPAGEHSGLVGWINDGWSIYGRFESGSDLPTDLDECNGHWGPTPGGKVTYHYHTSSYYPFVNGCYGQATKPADCTLDATGAACVESSIRVYPREPETCSGVGTSDACPASGGRGRPTDTAGTADCTGEVSFVQDNGAITTTLVGGVCMNDPTSCPSDTHTWVGSLCGNFAGSGSCGCCIEGSVAPGGAPPRRVLRTGAPPSDAHVWNHRRLQRAGGGSGGGGGGPMSSCSDPVVEKRYCDSYSCSTPGNELVDDAAATQCAFLGCDERVCCLASSSVPPADTAAPTAAPTTVITTAPTREPTANPTGGAEDEESNPDAGESEGEGEDIVPVDDPTPSDDDDDSSGLGLSTLTVSCGVVVLVLSVAAAAVFARRRRKLFDSKQQQQPQQPATAVWEEHRTDDDEIYYFNPLTGVTSWNKPE